jgi:hypothetical protein
MESKHTKLECIAEHGNVITKNRLIANCIGNGVSITEEDKANAELIAEAFNVTNSTSKTPQQLLEERNDLLKAAQIIQYAIQNNGSIGFFPDELNILEAAIKKANE